MGKTRIALVGGFASTNIGNDFFTRSIEAVLSRISPDIEVIVTQNLPGYYWKEEGTNPKSSFNYIAHLDVDYLVLTGPLFDTNFPVLWRDTLTKLKEKGTKFIFFSGGSQKYDETEREQVGAFLKEVEPYALVSRDNPTYEAYKSYAQHSYDGIDFAFFVGDLFKPYPLAMEKYVILNFDTEPEPKFGGPSQYGNQMEFLGKTWSYDPRSRSRIVKMISKRVGGLPEYYNDKFGEFPIIRPVNYINPANTKGLFKAPNTYVSELAFDYLNLLANAEGVLSSRVHSCIASLVFGKEVMLFSKTRRGQLFDRVGLANIRNKPVSIDQDYLGEEKSRMYAFIRGLFT